MDFIEFYEQYDEEGRLERHPSEFFVTTCLLDSLVPPAATILDVAGGTGRYAIYYAQRGHTVTLRDAVPKHIDLASVEISRRGLKHVHASVGDARDLECFPNASYDVVLCMGPAYHLSATEVRACYVECLRVLREGGLLVVAYVNAYEGWRENRYAEHFIHHSAEEMAAMISQFSLDVIYHVATDGPVFDELTALLTKYRDDRCQCVDWLEENRRILDDSIGLDTCIHGLLVGEKTQ